MKHYIWFVTLVAVLTMALVGCSKQKGVDTTKLQKSFAAADTTTQSTVNKIIIAVQSEDYPNATAELNKLATNAKLTPEQQQAIKDTLAQITKIASEQVQKAGEAATKAAGDVQKALPK
ncbi:MAG TPA: hypothetical protein VHR86_04160 [Armatimonadota bacterium]|nr:hypothetical protein [Armatimonadota bacterium]